MMLEISGESTFIGLGGSTDTKSPFNILLYNTEKPWNKLLNTRKKRQPWEQTEIVNCQSDLNQSLTEAVFYG